MKIYRFTSISTILVHAGILALFDAATKFDPEKQVAFSSYAKHRIKGAILDSLRQLDWASGTCGGVTSRWKRAPANLQPNSSGPLPKPKSPSALASMSTAGAR